RSEEHTSELQSLTNLVCRLLLEKKDNGKTPLTAAINKVWQTHNPQTVVRAVDAIDNAPEERERFFFFNDTATTEIYTLSLHDALPISVWPAIRRQWDRNRQKAEYGCSS